MPGKLPPEQQTLLEELADKGWDAYCAGKLGAGGAQLLRRAWEGDTGYLGWESLSRRLEPKLRGLAAFVLSHRYRRILNKPAEAKMLMETALRDAAPDSPLHKLAKAELEQLKSPVPALRAK